MAIDWLDVCNYQYSCVPLKIYMDNPTVVTTRKLQNGWARDYVYIPDQVFFAQLAISMTTPIGANSGFNTGELTYTGIVAFKWCTKIATFVFVISTLDHFL